MMIVSDCSGIDKALNPWAELLGSILVSYIEHNVCRDWDGGVKGNTRWLLDMCWGAEARI